MRGAVRRSGLTGRRCAVVIGTVAHAATVHLALRTSSSAPTTIRGVGVLFGSTNSNINYCDTWECDGTTVVQRNVATPPARWGHAMARDSDRDVVVIYGGRRASRLSEMLD